MECLPVFHDYRNGQLQGSEKKMDHYVLRSGHATDEKPILFAMKDWSAVNLKYFHICSIWIMMISFIHSFPEQTDVCPFKDLVAFQNVKPHYFKSAW